MLVLFTCLIALIIAQNPSVSNNFHTGVHVRENEKGHRREFHGRWYSDFAGNRERFDRDLHHGRVDFLRYWSSESAGTEYEVFVGNKTCKTRPFREVREREPFGFLKIATRTDRECHDQGHVWEARKGSFHFQLCVARDGRTPVWQLFTDRAQSIEFHTIFHGFVAGRPHSSNFNVPTGCSSTRNSELDVTSNARTGFQRHPSLRYTGSNSTCSLCQELVEFVVELIHRDNTIKQIIEEIRAACYGIPPPEQQMCLDAINGEIEAIFNWINDKKNPLEFCSYINVC